jgi:hypothetical protein
VFRTNGQSDQHRAFATMWRVPDNLLHFLFLNINARFGSDYFVLISQHNLGGKTTIKPFPPPPICQGGRNGYIAIFPGENLLYSHFSAYPGKGEIWPYCHDVQKSIPGGGNGYIVVFPPKLCWDIKTK